MFRRRRNGSNSGDRSGGSGENPANGGSNAKGGAGSTTVVGPAGGSSSYVPTECPDAEEDEYSILEDPAWATYQIRKSGASRFSRYESNAKGEEVVVSEDYQVVTAFPKRYLLSVVHAGKNFAIEETENYYIVDSDFELPNIPCVTDNVIYAPHRVRVF